MQTCYSYYQQLRRIRLARSNKFAQPRQRANIFAAYVINFENWFEVCSSYESFLLTDLELYIRTNIYLYAPQNNI